MIVKMKETIFNISGHEFKEGEEVEVIDVWINHISSAIYISVKLNDKYLITSIRDVIID